MTNKNQNAELGKLKSTVSELQEREKVAATALSNAHKQLDETTAERDALKKRIADLEAPAAVQSAPVNSDSWYAAQDLVLRISGTLVDIPAFNGRPLNDMVVKELKQTKQLDGFVASGVITREPPRRPKRSGEGVKQTVRGAA